MKRIIFISVLLASSAYANQALDELATMDTQALNETRGMFQIHDQDNATNQGGASFGNKIENSITGINAISPGSFVGANGIMLINLSSGNNNITNMSTNINIISAK